MKITSLFNRTQVVSLAVAVTALLAAALVWGILGVDYKPLTWALIAVIGGGLAGAVVGGRNASAPRAGAKEVSALFALGWGGMAALSVYDGIVTHDNEVIVIGVVFAAIGVLSIAWALRSSRSAP